jgi:hypothetical protein
MAAAWRWRRPRQAVLFLVVPLLWTIAHLGLSPRGSYVLDLDPGAGLVASPVPAVEDPRVLGRRAARLAAGGVVAVMRRDRRWGWGALFVLAVVAAAALAGHETPPGSGRISERMAHLPVLALCACAGWRWRRRWHAPAGSGARSPARRWWRPSRFSAGAGTHISRPGARGGVGSSLRLAVQVAGFAAGALPRAAASRWPGPPVDIAQVDAYVRKVAARGTWRARGRSPGASPPTRPTSTASRPTCRARPGR